MFMRQSSTTAAYASVHNGFDDWFPPVVFEHEDGEYVWTVFEGLCLNLTRSMDLLRKTDYEQSSGAVNR